MVSVAGEAVAAPFVARPAVAVRRLGQWED